LWSSVTECTTAGITIIMITAGTIAIAAGIDTRDGVRVITTTAVIGQLRFGTPATID
jgi:hypothetical protein